MTELQKLGVQILIAICACLATLLLAGCKTTESIPQEPQIVYVKETVKVPCIEDAPVRPAFRYGAGEWPGGKAAGAILADDFELAERWGEAWVAAAAGCIQGQKE